MALFNLLHCLGLERPLEAHINGTCRYDQLVELFAEECPGVPKDLFATKG